MAGSLTVTRDSALIFHTLKERYHLKPKSKLGLLWKLMGPFLFGTMLRKENHFGFPKPLKGLQMAV